MQQYLSDKYSLSKESKYIDLKTNKASSSTDLTNINTNSNNNNNNQAQLLINKDYLPKYYFKQLNIFNKAEYIKEDYKPSSTYLLNRIKEQQCQ